MALQLLFERSPVLPVDATISLARYLRTIRQTQRQAITTEKSGDLSRSALLHIRVLQLACKTLPSHPDYSLSENAGLLRQLRAVAHTSFHHIERLGTILVTSSPCSGKNTNSNNNDNNPSSTTTITITISSSLPMLFDRLCMTTFKDLVEDKLSPSSSSLSSSSSSPPSQQQQFKEHAMLGLLATRPGHSHVIALIIPAQTCGMNWSYMKYERDVAHLLEIKDLSIRGLITRLPNDKNNYNNSLPPHAIVSFAPLQTTNQNAVAIVIPSSSTPQHHHHYHHLHLPHHPLQQQQQQQSPMAFNLSEHAFQLAQTQFEKLKEKDKQAVIDDIVDELDGQPMFVPTRHIDWADDGTPVFKLYDLRPLRDDQQRRKSTERKAPPSPTS